MQIVYVAPGASFSTASISTLKNGKIYTLERIFEGQQWWIMFEPSELSESEVAINTWVSVETEPPAPVVKPAASSNSTG